MKNIEFLAKLLAKEKASNIMVQTVPKTHAWLISQKIDKSNNKWMLTLMKPEGRIIYNLGVIDGDNMEDLWTHLITLECKDRISFAEQARIYKERIAYYLKQINK